MAHPHALARVALKGESLSSGRGIVKEGDRADEGKGGGGERVERENRS